MGSTLSFILSSSITALKGMMVPLMLLSILAFCLVIYMIYKAISVHFFRVIPNRDGRDTCIITGPTYGIGKELAKLFVRDGINLIMIARSEEELQKVRQEFHVGIKKVKIFIIAKDLQDENAPQQIFDMITTGEEYRDLRFKYLVNNAGFCLRGEFLEIPLDRYVDFID